MWVKKVTDSSIFCDKTENTSLFMKKKCCKQEYSKEALSWYNLNPKGIIFPYDDKHIILLTSLRNNNPKL